MGNYVGAPYHEKAQSTGHEPTKRTALWLFGETGKNKKSRA
jgi:hypothetical protein